MNIMLYADPEPAVTPAADAATPTPAPAAKKVPAKKAALKRPIAKKAPAKKVAPKKAAASKPVPAPKKVAAKKAPARKAVAPLKATAPQAAAPAAPAKTAAVPAPQPAAKPVKKKDGKVKIVRDSFTMPEADFALIDAIKQRALGWRQPVKKSEVLRAALQALQALPDARVKALLSGLTPIKKGRPNKTPG